MEDGNETHADTGKESDGAGQRDAREEIDAPRLDDEEPPSGFPTRGAEGAPDGGPVRPSPLRALEAPDSILTDPDFVDLAFADASVLSLSKGALENRHHALLTTGGIFIKHGRFGRPHVRFVWMSQDLSCIMWR